MGIVILSGLFLPRRICATNAPPTSAFSFDVEPHTCGTLSRTKSMTSTHSDLRNALAFVIRRIEEEATRTGARLNADQRCLLQDLPTTSPLNDQIDPEVSLPIPRDLAFERLCALASAAHAYDQRTNPQAGSEWQLAAAVFKLNRHPMGWLLQWARIKSRVGRPWWDGLFLLAAALVLIVCAFVPLLLITLRNEEKKITPVEWALIGCAYAAVAAVLYFAARRIENWQLRRGVEISRANHRPAGS
jgi:hypothetical protein